MADNKISVFRYYVISKFNDEVSRHTINTLIQINQSYQENTIAYVSCFEIFYTI